MKKSLSFLLCLTMVFSLSAQTFAADIDAVSIAMNETAEYLHKSVPSPQVDSIGGEWLVLGLARSGADIPQIYFENYYQNVKNYVEDKQGILHDKKYTEYSRVILALTAIGKNPTDVAGYNLLMPLEDYDKTVWQGINGAIFALIALDSGNYITQNTVREKYVNYILEKQTDDGGWAMSGNTADIDVTAMALQALAKYQDNEAVKTATEKALLLMSQSQDKNGGFSSQGIANSESCAQMIVALCELGIPLDDSRFVKNGNTILDGMLTYYEKGKGFKHTSYGEENQMATEQCFYTLVAVNRYNEGKNSLYNMSDVISVSEDISQNVGLSAKNPAVQKMSVVHLGKTFEDIKGHKNQTAIEGLSERGIINGKTENSFEPQRTMTRAEFATIMVRGLGLPEKGNADFMDVTENDWFCSYVNTAYCYGIVNGVSETNFNPNGTITREEAAVMVTRAAKLCGMDTEVEILEARDILAGFLDYVTASDWAVCPLAFCYDNKILPDDAMEINPKEFVTRAEIAQMLYNMLLLSELI